MNEDRKYSAILDALHEPFDLLGFHFHLVESSRVADKEMEYQGSSGEFTLKFYCDEQEVSDVLMDLSVRYFHHDSVNMGGENYAPYSSVYVEGSLSNDKYGLSVKLFPARVAWRCDQKFAPEYAFGNVKRYLMYAFAYLVAQIGDVWCKEMGSDVSLIPKNKESEISPEKKSAIWAEGFGAGENSGRDRAWNEGYQDGLIAGRKQERAGQ